MGGAIDLSNLYDLVGTATAGRSPILRFSLNSIPDAGSYWYSNYNDADL